jgi:hypothetical protein
MDHKITILDRFAAHAMDGLLAVGTLNPESHDFGGEADDIIRMAYILAEKMLAEKLRREAVDSKPKSTTIPNVLGKPAFKTIVDLRDCRMPQGADYLSIESCRIGLVPVRLPALRHALDGDSIVCVLTIGKDADSGVFEFYHFPGERIES